MAEAALRYKDKVTIVTGGSSGIGRGCVEVFGEYDSLGKGNSPRMCRSVW